ncbi:MAG: hypothetical protein OXT67_09950, partial [Zetaproteobacteria bacterium]|nr:hypothetical protein [Zetaproteobacteria bacterium]
MHFFLYVAQLWWFLGVWVPCQVRAATPGVDRPYYFDAEQSHFDVGGEWQDFEGDVIALTDSVAVVADHIRVNHRLREVVAEGHVLVLSPDSVATGSSFTMQGEGLHFEIVDARLTHGDRDKFERLLREILGLTRAELAFEAARKRQISDLKRRKAELSLLYLRLGPNLSVDDHERILMQYALLLRQEALQQQQPNPSHVLRSPEKQQRFEKRRAYWNTLRKAAKSKVKKPRPVYFEIQSDRLQRIGEDQYLAQHGKVTPCACEEDEAPAWSIYADKIEAEDGAYMDFNHPVLMIKDVPVLYLPYWKMPFKNTRQTGFLLPEFSYSRDNGTTFSQPLFIDIAPNEDVTFTTKHIEKRGVGLGLEWRKKLARYSGWQISVDGIRDYQYAEKMSHRSWLVAHYADGLRQASVHAAELSRAGRAELEEGHPDKTTVADPQWWADQNLNHCLHEDNVERCIQNDVQMRLLAGAQAWRGSLNWRGRDIFSARVSAVSAGKVMSDHRYDTELELPTFELLTKNAAPGIFAPARMALHYDGSDHYLGLTSRFADPLRSHVPYSGYQVPLELRWRSRYFSLLPEKFPWPLYLQAALDARQLDRFQPVALDKNPAENVAQLELRRGTWSRFASSLRMPLLSESIFQADLFSTWETRWIQPSGYDAAFYNRSQALEGRNFDGLPLQPTTLRTVDMGIHFNLPMDGRWQSAPTAPLRTEGSQPMRVIEHYMNWDVTFAYRPFVDKVGDYGDLREYASFVLEDSERGETAKWVPMNADTKALTYYPSDAALARSRILTLSTHHEWLTHQEDWRYNPPKYVDRKKERDLKDLRQSLDRAQDELSSLQRQKPRLAGDPKWQHVTREIPSLDLAAFERASFADFETVVFYDFEVAQEREQLLRQAHEDVVARLPEPWSPITSKLNLRYAGWALGLT